MTRYEIEVNAKGNWELDNSDLLICHGVKELKETIETIKEEGVKIEKIYSVNRNFIYKDVTNRYIK